jgi:hypothetical protein
LFLFGELSIASAIVALLDGGLPARPPHVF